MMNVGWKEGSYNNGSYIGESRLRMKQWQETKISNEIKVKYYIG